MSNYTKSTNFATKDNLTPGDPLKIVRGTEIDTEFNNIATAIATKTDNASAAITGGSITGITDLAIADGGTGASTANAALNNLLPSQASASGKYLKSNGTDSSWDALDISTADITGTLPVANGGTGVTSSTGTGSVVLSNSPTLVTPALGTPASGVATNITGLPISTGVSGLGTGVATALAVNVGSAGAPLVNGGVLGTPSSGTATNLTGLPLTTGVTGTLPIVNGGTGQTTANAAFNALAPSQATASGKYLKSDGTNTSWDALDISTADITGTLPVANGGTGVTTSTGTGSVVLSSSPTLVTPALGTPSSATLTNATGLPISTGVSGLGTGVATALGVAVGSAGAPVVNGGALGTPSSGTVTNLTGTASININGTVGATTPTTGAFTTTTVSTSETLSYGTANGVTYLNGSKVLTSGSALTFDGTTLGAPQVLLPNGNSYQIKSAAGVASAVLGVDASNNLYLGASGAIATNIFYTGGSEQMRLTSTGLGIGTSSPAAKLDVSGNAYVSGKIALGGTTITDNNLLNIQGSNAVNNIGIVLNKTNGTAQIWGVQNSGPLVFFDYTASAERMRLDTAGNLGLENAPNSAWSGRALQLKDLCALSTTGAGNTSSALTHGAYWDGTNWKYLTASVGATRYQMTGANGGSTHSWSVSAGGTAGTNISFTQAMTLGSDGNLAVGTTSTSGARLKVDGGDTAGTIGQFGNAQGGVILGAASSVAYVDTTSSTPLAFRINGTERARIDSSGNLLLNKTTTDFGTNGVAFIAGAAMETVGSTNRISAKRTTDGNVIEFYQTINVGTISITSSATAYNTSSDYRLKDNQQPLVNSGLFIDALQPKTWTWKVDGSKGVGFIAHEVQAVSPNSVVGQKDAVDENGNPIMQGMEYGSAEFIANIIAEIQSLRRRLAVLEAK